MTDASGVVETRLSYAAYGRWRNEASWSGNPSGGEWSGITNTTRHGYTGHEMLDNLDLTHMNGRVYDQRVGRFLSVDPYIDGVLNTQGWNRYAYVKNNPLSFVDPSGFGAEDEGGECISSPELGTGGGPSSGCSSGDNTGGGGDSGGSSGNGSPGGTGSTIAEVVVTRSFIPLSPPPRSGLNPLPFDPNAGSMPQVAGYSGGRGSGTPQEQSAVGRTQEQDPCVDTGTLEDFVAKNGFDIADRTFDILGGLGQIGLGAGMCAGVVSCIGGGVLIVQGLSNLYEGVFGQPSLVRQGYQAAFGSYGNLAYSAVDITSSAYGLTRSVVRPDTFKLFRNISSDYVPAFRVATATELASDGIGLATDIANAGQAMGLRTGKCKP